MPAVADSDGGGEDDGRELQFGRDPRVADDDVPIPEGTVLGDIVLPPGVTIGDVVAILRFAVLLDVPTLAQLVLADLSPLVLLDGDAVPPKFLRIGDGIVDITDVVAALRVTVELQEICDP